MASQRGMGRGLSAILTPQPAEDAHGDDDLRRLPIDALEPNPDQPRRSFDEDALVALAESLRERGVLQPVLVRPRGGGRFEIVAGERRWRAARLAGLETVPALVRPHDDAETLEVALVENMARQDLNPVEEARACALLVDELGLTREQLGRRVGRSRVAVSNLMRLLDLPEEALDLLAESVLSEGHGKALLMAADHDDRRRLARRAAAEGWTVRQVEAAARRANAPSTPTVAAGPHPDQEAAVAEIADRLGGDLAPVARVVARGAGYRITLTVDSLDDALDLASRLRGREAR